MTTADLPPQGILLVDKAIGLSSAAVVSKVRRALGQRKVGHAGTLDPEASGLLVLGVGRGTRLLTFLVGVDKEYLATIRLGVGTDTDDAAGRIVAAPGCTATPAEVGAAVTGFIGAILQRPSDISAIKVDGRRAYARVRAGETVELPARPVTIQSLDVTSHTAVVVDGVPVRDVTVVARVSSGTYIRALARDLGEALGSAGHLTALRRTEVGPFCVADAHGVESLQPSTALLSLGAVAAAALPTVVIPPDRERLVRSGVRIDCPPGREGGVDDSAATALLGEDGTLLAVATIAEGRWRYALVVP